MLTGKKTTLNLLFSLINPLNHKIWRTYASVKAAPNPHVSHLSVSFQLSPCSHHCPWPLASQSVKSISSVGIRHSERPSNGPNALLACRVGMHGLCNINSWTDIHPSFPSDCKQTQTDIIIGSNAALNMKHLLLLI